LGGQDCNRLLLVTLLLRVVVVRQAVLEMVLVVLVRAVY
jgi:hypothetical protein